MKTEDYLSMVGKLNMLVNNKLEEKEELFTLATKTTQEISDMPHASGVSDKVGNLAVKLASKEEDIDHAIDVYIDLKHEIISQIEKLPKDEYDVLYRRYVVGQGLFDVAEKRDQSVSWIQKLTWRGLKKIKVIESDVYREACKMLGV